MRTAIVSLAAATLDMLAGAGASSASVVTANPNLPPDTGAYFSLPFGQATYLAPGLQLVLTNIALQPIAATAVSVPVGPDEREDFSSAVQGLASINGAPGVPFGVSGPETTMTFGKIGNTTGTFQTEMLALDLSGGGIMIRESPTLPSLGQTSITNIGGGLFRIDSFFDVFTELSLDGGQSWIPDSNGPLRINLDVPAPGAAALLGLGGIMAIRRRRAHA